jgi:hypothetical protein
MNPVCDIVWLMIPNLVISSLMDEIQDQSISSYLLNSLSVLTLATGNWSFLTTKTILTLSKLILTKRFGHPFQETVTLGISFLGGPQKPDTMGMTFAEEQATLKQYRNARKSFADKELCLS